MESILRFLPAAMVAIFTYFYSTPEYPFYKFVPCLSLGVCTFLFCLQVTSARLLHLPIFFVTALTWIYFCAPFLYESLPRVDPRRVLREEDLWNLSIYPSLSIFALVLGYYSVASQTLAKPFFSTQEQLSNDLLVKLSSLLCISGILYLIVNQSLPEVFTPLGRILGILENLTLFGVIFSTLLYLRRGMTPMVLTLALVAFLAQSFVIVSNTLFARLAYYITALGVTIFASQRKIPWIPAFLVLIVIIPMFANRKKHRFSTSQDVNESTSTLYGRISRGFNIAVDDMGNWDWSNTIEASNEILSSRLENVSFLGHCVYLHESGKQFKHGETFSSIYTVLIPRIFWADKPKQDQGNVLATEYGFKDKGFHVAINFPWLAELYINFGYEGMLIGSVILGSFFRLSCEFAGFGVGDINLLVFCDLLWWLLCNENNLSMVVGGILQILVVWWIIKIVAGSMLNESRLLALR
ncbi:MAG TPA: hypothetical protein PKN47_22690 [Nitrospira sp.]|nr:hypothetical protein [Nitrospira sp.]